MSGASAEPLGGTIGRVRSRAMLDSSLLAGAVGTVALNVATTGINFGLTFVLAHALGARGYGAYAFAFAWANVLAVPSALGLGPLVVREVAAYRARMQWGSLRGLIRRGNELVLASAVVVAVVGAGAGMLIERGHPQLLRPFLLGLTLVPVLSLTSLRQSAMQGLGRVVLGRLPETLVAPLGFATLALAWSLTGTLTPSETMLLQLCATVAAFALGVWLLRRSTPPEVAATAPAYATRRWLRSAAPFVLIGAVLALNAQVGTILVGALRGAYDAGVFGLATRIGLFTSFLWLAASYPLMPAVARINALGDVDGLQRMLTRFGRIVLAATIPVALAVLVLAPEIVRIFGGSFGDAAMPLRIIALGELAKVATGFGGLALTMAGGELAATGAMVSGTAVTIVLDLLLIPFFGVAGAACGSAAGAVLANVLSLHLARSRLGLRVALLW